MGEQLIGRPLSQRQGFATLNTASNPFSSDLSRFLSSQLPPSPGRGGGGGFKTQPEVPLQMRTANLRMPMSPSTLWGNLLGGFKGRQPIWPGRPMNKIEM